MNIPGERRVKHCLKMKRNRISSGKWIWGPIVALGLVSPSLSLSGEVEKKLQERLEMQADAVAGYASFGQPKIGAITSSKPVEMSLVLMPGYCYLFHGAGETDGSLFDLEIQAGGKTVARSSDPSPSPILVYCPSAMMSGKTTLRCKSGCGQAILASYRRELRIPPLGDGAEPLPERLGDLAGSIGVGDPAQTPQAGRLNHGESKDIAVELPGGKCYWLLAVGGNGVQDLDMVLFSGGNELGRSEGDRSWPVLSWCASSDTKADARVTMYTGAGEFLFAVYATQGAEPASRLLVGGAERDMLANRMRQASLIHASGKRPVAPPWRGTLREGQTASLTFDLPSQRCIEILAVVEIGLQSVSADLQTEKGQSLGRATLENGILLLKPSSCPLKRGDYRIRLSSVSGSGQYLVQVFGD